MRIEASGDVSYMVSLLTDRPLSTPADGEKGEKGEKATPSLRLL